MGCVYQYTWCNNPWFSESLSVKWCWEACVDIPSWASWCRPDEWTPLTRATAPTPTRRWARSPPSPAASTRVTVWARAARDCRAHSSSSSPLQSSWKIKSSTAMKLYINVVRLIFCLHAYFVIGPLLYKCFHKSAVKFKNELETWRHHRRYSPRFGEEISCTDITQPFCTKQILYRSKLHHLCHYLKICALFKDHYLKI